MTQSWAEEQAHRIAKEVRSLRGDRSAQWLSDRTAELGYTVTRSVIADLENGRRKYVTTAELCVLAWALRVPPIRLLYPALPDGPVEIVPGETYPSIVAVTWFSGETLFLPELTARDEAADDDEWLRDAEHTRDVSAGAKLVELARERITQESRIKSLSGLIARLRASDDPSLADPFVDEIAGAEARIRAANAQLRQIEGAVLVNDGDD